MQLSFEYYRKLQETKEGQEKVARIIADLLLFSLQLEADAVNITGAASAQRRLTQERTAKKIRSIISA